MAMATYFKFPDGIISSWEFQLEMTYTHSTLKGSTAKQTLNGIHTNSQTIKIHLSNAYYEKNVIQKSWKLKKQTAEYACCICKNIIFPRIHYLLRHQVLWV